MGKDRNELKRVSSLFTEEMLEDILRKVSKGKEVKIVSWDFGAASNKGDGYLSILNRVKVIGEADGQMAELCLIVKSMPENLGRRKTFRSTEFFYNEVLCYNEIFPKFKEFLKSKGRDNLMVIPRCLMAINDGENDFIVLEDVSVLGFVPVTRQNTLTFSECSLILETLAKFHAVSFAYKDQRKEEFQKLTKNLLETNYAPRLYNWQKGYETLFINASKDALAKEHPGSKVEERFNSWSEGKLYNKMIDFCSRTDAPTSIITHGDTWAPNFLIKKSDEQHSAALALDFQASRCASPVLDISHFIFTCTEKSLRDNHYDDLLKLYHDQLSRSIESLGSDPEKLYPWDVFMKEVQELSLYGVYISLEAIPVQMLPSSEAYDMDVFEGDEVIEISKIWNLKPIKSKEARRRLTDVISDAVEKNYI